MSIAIDSEDDAWRTLSQLVNGKLDIASVDELEFGDWVKLRVYIHEKRYDSALNTYMMQGWQDAQRALYRSYAITAKGAADARSLTDSEREKLQLVVKIKCGSSDQEADLTDVLKEAVLAALGKMEPTQIATLLIVVVLSWAGGSITRHWISERAESKRAEIAAGPHKDANTTLLKALETIQKVAGDQTNADLIAKAIKEQPVLRTFADEAEVARHSMVKHASQSDAVVNGVTIPAAVGRAVTQETRTETVEERRDGNYRVRKVDTTVPDGFRVFVENVENQETFAADVQEVMSSANDRVIIKDAEWSKIPVRLQINAKVKKGVAQAVTILKADKVEVDSDPATSA
ncbi:MAG: hypothetical protein HOL57_01825 [Marinovum sp.]|nr:hypothetical protein [Marinovum sp.]